MRLCCFGSHDFFFDCIVSVQKLLLIKIRMLLLILFVLGLGLFKYAQNIILELNIVKYEVVIAYSSPCIDGHLAIQDGRVIDIGHGLVADARVTVVLLVVHG